MMYQIVPLSVLHLYTILRNKHICKKMQFSLFWSRGLIGRDDSQLIFFLSLIRVKHLYSLVSVPFRHWNHLKRTGFIKSQTVSIPNLELFKMVQANKYTMVVVILKAQHVFIFFIWFCTRSDHIWLVMGKTRNYGLHGYYCCEKSAPFWAYCSMQCTSCWHALFSSHCCITCAEWSRIPPLSISMWCRFNGPCWSHIITDQDCAAAEPQNQGKTTKPAIVVNFFKFHEAIKLQFVFCLIYFYEYLNGKYAVGSYWPCWFSIDLVSVPNQRKTSLFFNVSSHALQQLQNHYRKAGGTLI